MSWMLARRLGRHCCARFKLSCCMHHGSGLRSPSIARLFRTPTLQMSQGRSVPTLSQEIHACLPRTAVFAYLTSATFPWDEGRPTKRRQRHTNTHSQEHTTRLHQGARHIVPLFVVVAASRGIYGIRVPGNRRRRLLSSVSLRTPPCLIFHGSPCRATELSYIASF